MTPLLASSPLFKMFYSALAAGLGSAIVFSLAVLGAIRSSEMRRVARGAAATAYGALAVCSLLLSAGIVVYGLVVVVHKS